MLALVLVSVAVVAFASATQAVTGFGFALLAVPLLALLLDPHTAVVSVTGVALVLSTLGAARERSHVEWRSAGMVALTSLLGIPAGLFVLASLSLTTLYALIAVVVLSFTALLAFRLRVPPGRHVEVAAGVSSGALLAATGMNGPPLVLAFQAMRLPPRAMRATLQAAFAAQGALVCSGLLATDQFTQTSLAVIGAGLPALTLGWLVGERLFHRVPAELYSKLVLTTLVVSGLLALVRAFAG